MCQWNWHVDNYCHVHETELIDKSFHKTQNNSIGNLNQASFLTSETLFILLFWGGSLWILETNLRHQHHLTRSPQTTLQAFPRSQIAFKNKGNARRDTKGPNIFSAAPSGAANVLSN